MPVSLCICVPLSFLFCKNILKTRQSKVVMQRMEGAKNKQDQFDIRTKQIIIRLSLDECTKNKVEFHSIVMPFYLTARLQ